MVKTSSWVSLLTQWKFGHLTQNFAKDNFIDPNEWYYFSPEQLTELGLKNKKQRDSFKKFTEQWLRQSWTTNSPVEVYSQSRNKWFGGHIVKTLNDGEGEWLTIRYNKSTSKQVQRFCEDVRPVQIKKAKSKTKSKTTSKESGKATSKKESKEGEGKKKPRQRSHSVVLDKNVLGADLSALVEISQTTNTATTEEKSNTSTKAERDSWQKSDYVEVFSRSKNRWLTGSIYEIGNDEEGEYLEVHYHDQSSKQSSRKRVGRYDEEVRGYQLDPEEILKDLTLQPTGNAGEEAANIITSPAKGTGSMNDNFFEKIEQETQEINQRTLYNVGAYPESPQAIDYRMKGLGDLRRECLQKRSFINELQETIQELTGQLQSERRQVMEIEKRLRLEEEVFKQQEDVILRQTRKRWKPGDFMEVYSNSRKKWFMCECVDIFEDKEGEWLQVFFSDRDNGQQIMKQIQRFSEDLRPCRSVLIPPLGYSVSDSTLSKIHEIPEREEAERLDWEAMLKESEQNNVDQENFDDGGIIHPMVQGKETSIDAVVSSRTQNAGVNSSSQQTSNNTSTRGAARRQSTNVDQDEVSNHVGGEGLKIIFKDEEKIVHAQLSQPVSVFMIRLKVLLHVDVDNQVLSLKQNDQFTVLKPADTLLSYGIQKGSVIYLDEATNPQKAKEARKRLGREKGVRQSQSDLFGPAFNTAI